MFDLVLADTCIGGSTVAARIVQGSSGVRAFFMADYSVNPLGVKSAAQVRTALERWLALAAKRAPMLVVACNTASVRLEQCPEVRDRASALGLTLVSMVDLLDRAIATHQAAIAGRRVCVMGTRFTVSQSLYAKRLLSAGAREVVGLAATMTERTVAHLEHTTEAGERAIRDEIGDAIRHCDAVLLACTCFPLVAGLIGRLNPDGLLIDPATGVDSLVRFARPGANVMTLGLSGAGDLDTELRATVGGLFPGWEIDRVEDIASDAYVSS